jgi:hypothetical protein
VLDGGVKPLPIGSADYGAAWNWRIGASSKPAGDPANLAVSFAPSARGLRPWRPWALSQTFAVDPSGPEPDIAFIQEHQKEAER